MYGVIRFSNRVGIGSSEHDLVGHVFISLTISLADAGSNEFSGGTWRGVMFGLLADAVDTRMVATLS
jgi:hypothetical protein